MNIATCLVILGCHGYFNLTIRFIVLIAHISQRNQMILIYEMKVVSIL